MNKEGLSAVIVTLIMILLGLVVAGIIWAVVNNVVSEGSEDISLGRFLVDLQIEQAQIENGDININLKRGAGDVELVSINFIISDGKNSQVVNKETNLQELGKSSFTITQEEFSDISFPKEISIAPVIEENGQEKTGNIVDTEKISLKEYLLNLDAVSWWKLDGNPDDEMGNNDGTEVGDITYESGIDENALKIPDSTDSDGIILISAQEAENYESTFSYSLWFKSETTDGKSAAKIISRNCDDYYCIKINQKESPDQSLTHTDTDGNINTQSNYNKWHHIVVVWNYPDNVELYLNGTSQGTNDPDDFTDVNMPIVIGGNAEEDGGVGADNFIGLIDQVIFFDKALSKEEVESIYNLNSV